LTRCSAEPVLPRPFGASGAQIEKIRLQQRLPLDQLGVAAVG